MRRFWCCALNRTLYVWWKKLKKMSSSSKQVSDVLDSSANEGAKYSLHPEPSPSRERKWFLSRQSGKLVGQDPDPAGDKGGPPSQRIRHSLLQLDQVLSSPGTCEDEVAPLGLGLSYNNRSEISEMDNSILLKNLHLAPTPIHDITQMSRLVRQPRPFSDTLLEDTVLGEDTTVLQDPTRKVGVDLVMAFHRELSVHSKPYQVLDMISALEKCCEVQHKLLTTFEKQTRFSVDQLQSELCLEMATWQLLHILAQDRHEEEDKRSQETTMIGNGASDKILAEQLFAQDSLVRQAQLVVDWLEGLARVGLEQYPAKAAYFTDSVCWENTLHDITHGIDSDVLVTEMDPDASTRQHRKLSGLDARDELSLNKHLFTCIRAGQLDKALSLCVTSGQPLKALMLEGWKLHHDPNIGLMAADELEQMEGNEFRDVWKWSCWQMLNEQAYDVYEKATFAALSGNVEKVLPACQTWYDYVWAYFKTLVDVQVEKALRRQMTTADRDIAELPPQFWTAVLLPEQVFQEVEASPSAEIQLQSKSHFHLMQKYIILDDMNGLLEEMVSWLSSQPSLHLLRVMAHIGLVVRTLGRVRESSQVDVIVEAYVKALTEGHYQSAVALYAAQLPASSQVSSYAHLLAGVREEEKQRHCLELGREAGLDIGMVTKTVVENIRTTGQLEDREKHVAPSAEPEQDMHLSELDLEKVRAINWLVFEEAQRPEAIKQGNALIRHFLTTRKFSAAQAVLNKIPADSVQVISRLWQQQAGASPLPADIAADVTELEALKAYLNGIEKFNCWFEHFHHNKPVQPPAPADSAFQEDATFQHRLAQYEQENEQWKTQANLLAEEASDALQAVLVFPGGWMSGGTQVEDAEESVLQQLQALRQICIPEICFLLHSVLHASCQYKKCVQISDMVISEKSKLYKDFTSSQLKQLLVLLQKSALHLVCESTTNELGYTIT